jgi:CheY-like chemotaxis protein
MSAAVILVVDDDEDLLAMARFIFEGAGYFIVTASNGREALAAVAARMPDVIVLDMKMPVMDGADFAAELRRRYVRRPPIVVVTAADDARKRAIDIGAAGWVGKPFDIRDLLHAVAEQLRCDQFQGSRARSAQ